MSAVYIYPQQMLPAEELIESVDTTPALIGTLLYPPIKLILDNQSIEEAILHISLDGGNTLIQWKTFTAGEVLILDDDIYTFPKGAMFYAEGEPQGFFSISYTYINL